MLVYQRVFVDPRHDQPSGSLVMTHEWSSKHPLKTTRLGKTNCRMFDPQKTHPDLDQNPEKIESTAW